MAIPITSSVDLTRPVALAADVYWIGRAESLDGLQSNSFLIVDGDEAVVIDGGSRPDFSAVLMKIMQVGLAPGAITTLIYQQPDPDRCGSIAHFEEIIGRPDLRIVSKRENNALLRTFGVKSVPLCVEALGYSLALRSGRVLRFIPTPYAPSPGSFMTFDETSSVLFTGDMLGTLGVQGERTLLDALPAGCVQCLLDPTLVCNAGSEGCAVQPLMEFHRALMPSSAALRMACRRIAAVPAQTFAPQHGRVWRRADAEAVLAALEILTDVGIDRVPTENAAWA